MRQVLQPLPKFYNLFSKLYNTELEITATFATDEKVSCFHIGSPLHWFFDRCHNPYALLYGKACKHGSELRVNKKMPEVPIQREIFFLLKRVLQRRTQNG